MVPFPGRPYHPTIALTGNAGPTMMHGVLLLADRHPGMLGSVHGLLRGLFEAVVMVADERSLMAALTAVGSYVVFAIWLGVPLPRGPV